MSCSCLNSRKKYYERYKVFLYFLFMTSCRQQEMSQLSKVDELLNKGQFEHADMLLRKAEKESLNSEALRAYFSFLFYLVFWNDLISEEEASSKE